MAKKKAISETIAETTEVLTEVKALLAKAETSTEPADKKEEGEEKTPAEEKPAEEEAPKAEDEEKKVTREEFDEVVERLKKLEAALEEKKEEVEALRKVTEEASVALNGVKAYFRDPSNRAQFAEGVEPSASAEAAEGSTKTALEKWRELPVGSRASVEFYEAHKAEIASQLKAK